MIDRPILFNTEMVRAILDGRKTQTRRTARLKDLNSQSYWRYDGIDASGNFLLWNIWTERSKILKCPYGETGDLLWVRETFMSDGVYVGYRAGPITWDANAIWSPSIFMPRWASRITLEITKRRLERLQDITEDDCFAEGMTNTASTVMGEARIQFRDLWDSINAKRGYSWDSNPWVWVIEFRRVEE